MSRDHNIPAWWEAEAIAATRVGCGSRSGEESSLPALEARRHCRDLDSEERIAIFVDNQARNRAHRLQMEDELSAKFADGQLDNFGGNARCFRAIRHRLVSILGGAQLITAGRDIAERETAVGVSPSNGILCGCFDGGKGDDRPANRCIIGIQDNSCNSAKRGCLRGCLRERANRPNAKQSNRHTE